MYFPSNVMEEVHAGLRLRPVRERPSLRYFLQHFPKFEPSQLHSGLKQVTSDFPTHPVFPILLGSPDDSEGSDGIEFSATLISALFLWVCCRYPLSYQFMSRNLHNVQPVCRTRAIGGEPFVVFIDESQPIPAIGLKAYRLPETAVFDYDVFASQALRRVTESSLELLKHPTTDSRLRMRAEKLIEQHQHLFESDSQSKSLPTAWDEVIAFGGLYIMGASTNEVLSIPNLLSSFEAERWYRVRELMRLVECMLGGGILWEPIN